MAGETVTRVRQVADGVDRYGNPTFSEVEEDFGGAFFAPEQSSSEALAVGRTVVTVSPTLYFPKAWPDIASGDAVRVRGERFEVDGVPADWRDPWGTALGGLVVTLKRVQG